MATIITELRKAAGYEGEAGVARLAKAGGIAPSTWRKYECGVCVPARLDQAIRLAGLIGVRDGNPLIFQKCVAQRNARVDANKRARRIARSR